MQACCDAQLKLFALQLGQFRRLHLQDHFRGGRGVYQTALKVGKLSKKLFKCQFARAALEEIALKDTFNPGLEWTFGNRLESLADALCAAWRQNPDIWLERRVVVPNRAIGHWLQHYVAAKLGICAGMQWWTPHSLALELQRDDAFKQRVCLPTKGELQLSIHSALIANLSDGKSPNSSLWLPLKSALSSSNGEEQLDVQRLAHFCRLMADIFERYSEFGASAVRKWEKSSLIRAENWQAHLWRSLFGKGGPWCSLSSFCAQLGDELKFDFKRSTQRQELYVFALRHLSSAHWRLLRRASAKMRVSLFALSPCRYYWTDVRSKREQKRFLRWIATKGASASTLEAFESSLRQSHPLLANLGKVGRRFVEKSESGNAPIAECYALPAALAAQMPYSALWQQDVEKVAGRDTLLSRLQADLLFMRLGGGADEDNGVEGRAHCDGSIEIHCASSRAREVEIAAALIHRALQADQTLTPSDVLLLAPDVQEYEALAMGAFARDPFGLKLRILEKNRSSFGGFWQSLSALLQWAEGGFGAQEALSALENPLIQKSIGLSAKEAAILAEHMRAGGVDWGLDAEHRLRHLEVLRSQKSARALNRGTWREFHDVLLRGLAFRDEPTTRHQALLDPTLSPSCSIEDMATTSLILQRWLHWFELVCTHLLSIAERASLSMNEWMHVLMEAAKGLLPACSDQDAERSYLLNWCRSWRQRAGDHAVLASSIQSTPLSWRFAREQLDEHMATSGGARAFRQGGIRLASLGNCSAIPARITLVMGLSEGALPRAHLRQPFELTAAEGMEFAPSPGDWDRCFFLEVLLAARDKLFLTYCAAERDDSLEIQEPSLLVGELLFTLGQMVDNRALRHPRALFEQNGSNARCGCHFYHPPVCFDAGYFAKNSPLLSFDQAQFQCAQAAQSTRHLPLGFRMWGIYPRSDESIEKRPLPPAVTSFTLRQLGKALHNPLEFHLQERCRISLWRQRPLAQQWLLRKSDQRKLQKLLVMKELKEPLIADNRLHVIAHANFQRLEGDGDELLSSSILNGEPGLQLHVTSGVEHLYKLDEKNWLMPAKTRQIGEIRLNVEGEFGDDQWLGPWGLVLIGKDNRSILSTICRHWAHILTFCEAQSEIGARRCVHFGGSKSWEIENLDLEQLWLDLMNFALAAYRAPLPLLPDWFDSYERGDARELEKCFYKEMSKRMPGHPHTLHWVFGERVDSSLFDQWIEQYRAHWHKFFSPVMRFLKAQIDTSILSVKQRAKIAKPPRTF